MFLSYDDYMVENNNNIPVLGWSCKLVSAQWYTLVCSRFGTAAVQLICIPERGKKRFISQQGFGSGFCVH